MKEPIKKYIEIIVVKNTQEEVVYQLNLRIDLMVAIRIIINLLVHLKNRQAHSVKLCALVDKPDRRLVDVHVDYLGYTVPDEFVIGYGLDYNEEYRNLPYIGVLKEEVYKK